MEYKIENNKQLILAEVKCIIPDKMQTFKIEQPDSSYEPTKFFTATTDMKDWIANVRDIYESKGDILVTAEGLYNGIIAMIKNIKVRDDAIKKNGERIMVTEHVNVAGGFDMLATKKRILDINNPNINFINIGWKSQNNIVYLRIDPYTGESKQCFEVR